MQEQILGIIPNVKTGGVFKAKAANLIVTNERLIVANLTNEMLREAAKQASEEAKAQGKGILKRMASTMTSGMKYFERYYSMTPDAIITEQPANHAFKPEMISHIKVKMGTTHEDGQHTPNELILKTDQGKYKYQFTTISTSQAKDILKQLFPNHL